MLQLGSTFAIVGILGLISFEDRMPLLLSFVSIGFGLANIVPTLFLTIAKQKDMPVSSAMPIAATLGYTGMLTGPAVLGVIAESTNLNISFATVAATLLFVAISAGSIKNGC